MRLYLIILITTVLTACANVKVYHRDILADPIMRPVDDVEEASYENHMMRALTQGLTGGPAAGSGCGCEQ